MLLIEKLDGCPNGCDSSHWAYDRQRCRSCGWDNLAPDHPPPHDCELVTQDARLQNDREWREKVEWQKQRTKELVQQHDERLIQLEAALRQARRELLQMDAALTSTSRIVLRPSSDPKGPEFIAEIEGNLVIWENEGGFSASSIEIDDKDLSVWLAEQLNIPITARGVPAQGEHGHVKLKLYR